MPRVFQTASDKPSHAYHFCSGPRGGGAGPGGKRRAFWDQVFREKEAVGFPGGRAWTTVGLRRESHTLAPAPAPLLWFESNKQMWKILEQGRAG